MLYKIFLSLSVAVLVLFNTFFDSGVSVTQNFPKKVELESEFTVEISVSKGDIQGFAKFQHEFPEGFEVSEVESKGGSFNYNNNTLKVIWISLPEESDFTIAYKVKLLPNAPRTAMLGGKFAYLENNERKTYDLLNEKIQIGPTDEEIERGPVEASVQRTIVQNSETSYTVNLKITKNGIQGFAKILEELPVGIKAEPNDKKDAVFSFVAQKAKFVWMSVPQDAEVEVSYNVTLENASDAAKLADIKGEFSYLQDDQTAKVDIQNAGDGAILAQNTESTSSAETAEPETTTEPVKQEPVKEEPVVKTEPVKEEPKTEVTVQRTEEPKPTATPGVEKGVTFKVQVMAAHKTVGAPYFKAAFNYTGKFDIENHNGWVKYTVGAHNTYSQARGSREDLRNYKFLGPFVTAYNQGERITVQEALMITNQKWIK